MTSATRRRRTLVARLDNVGDVLLAGPTIRAVAAQDEVIALTSPRGAAAAALLPGVSARLELTAPWISVDGERVERAAIETFLREISAAALDRAIILTSFHQDPLPLALLLRLAGVPWIGACSTDHPGTLLDVRHLPDETVHEVPRGLALAAACGYRLPEGDPGDLRLRAAVVDAGRPAPVRGPYTVVHPGATAPARTWSPAQFANLVDALRVGGRSVVVTGGPGEVPLTRRVVGPPGHGVVDLAGECSLADLARVIRDADVLVAGNTGPAHLAAAVGTPVVSIHPPTVPAARWRPWKVPHVLLGDPSVPCAGCRARVCPLARDGEQPCLAALTVHDVMAAVSRLSHARRRRPSLFARPGPRTQTGGGR